MAAVITSMFLPIRQSSYWPNSCRQTTPAAAMAMRGLAAAFVVGELAGQTLLLGFARHRARPSAGL